jgi:hypothetical protein
MGAALNGGIGIVANPASARDIRRPVAAGSVVAEPAHFAGYVAPV